MHPPDCGLDHLEREADRIATAVHVNPKFAGHKAALRDLVRACNSGYEDFATWRAESEQALGSRPRKLSRVRRHARDLAARWAGLYIRVATLINVEPDLSNREVEDLRATLRIMLFRVWPKEKVEVGKR